ncbi:MAG: sulfur oxidation c-type cytochrome SoxX [Acidocella sp. 20-57-95]|nr:MAG: sulfur oxidation c-type cytochrome SoxX [Acidocella sp. 20-57-95]OYV62226.1 MAG: sulfur oxidation c-type cytochrome SoxX [Acidocella sp. 21-58-7]HQT63735.1 sulfur oxidation c-type cytochrome SoxX [Acidocella sp.]HQU03110.1 sulfur oxidation c-type cytochrome SoxX [Acidocella sp.]
MKLKQGLAVLTALAGLAVPPASWAQTAPAVSAAAPAAPAPTVPPAVAAGQAIAFDRSKGNCLACHVIAGGSAMGNVGPALQNMKLLMPDPKQLYNVIYNEQARNPQTVMPAFGRNGILTPDEINDVVAYLYTK